MSLLVPKCSSSLVQLTLFYLRKVLLNVVALGLFKVCDMYLISFHNERKLCLHAKIMLIISGRRKF
jgi:hypothetical protein